MKLFKNSYVIVGFMLFALFFGASNLIYPAFLGLYSGGNLAVAILGFCLTGVVVPLLGVIAVAYSGATNVEEIVRPVSRQFAVLFSIAIYLLLGPLFVLPRTGTVSFDVGINPFFGDNLIIKIIYGLFFFGLAFWMAIKPSKLADIIGKYLTPALLGMIALLVVMSFISPSGDIGLAHNAASDITNAFKDSPFIAGLVNGYQTMDSLASLVYAIIVIEAIRGYGAKDASEVALSSFKSGLIATVFLALIYVFVGRIGATSQSLFALSDGKYTLGGVAVENGGVILGQVSRDYLGVIGQIALAIAVFLACLTTATGIVTACAEYFHKLQPKLSHEMWVGILLSVSLVLYFGGLSELTKWSGPFLFLLCPLAIVIILLIFLSKFFDNSPIVYRFAIGFTAIPALYDMLSSLSKNTGLFALPKGMVDFFTHTVPLGNYTIGWLTFAVVGTLIGMVVYKVLPASEN